MAQFVVDASVVTRWLLVEKHTDAAIRLRTAGHDLACPDFLQIEIANVVRVRTRRGQIDYAWGREIIGSIPELPLDFQPFEEILPSAWEIAVRFGRSVHEGLYLALAVALDMPLVTADTLFFNSVKRGELAEHVLWIEDVAA
jgi:predicted nucleic acid-binding protein